MHQVFKTSGIRFSGSIWCFFPLNSLQQFGLVSLFCGFLTWLKVLIHLQGQRRHSIILRFMCTNIGFFPYNITCFKNSSLGFLFVKVTSPGALSILIFLRCSKSILFDDISSLPGLRMPSFCGSIHQLSCTSFRKHSQPRPHKRNLAYLSLLLFKRGS